MLLDMRRYSRQVRWLTVPIFVAFAVIVCAYSVHAQLPHSGLTTVCDVASQPNKFEGESITVKALVQSDGLHGSQIYDESCKQFGMLLFLHPGAKGEDELGAALYWCHPGTRGKLISGTFTGVFHFKAVYIGDPARRQISISRIDDLVLKSTQTSSAAFPSPCPDAPPIDSLLHQPGKKDRPN
jgi:hypothetical protein